MGYDELLEYVKAAEYQAKADAPDPVWDGERK